MNRPHKLLLPALTLTLFLGYARPCSFPDDELIFVQRYGPDAPYDAFTKGRLGVILPTYRVRNLVVAYRYISGVPLTPDEQKAAAAVQDELDPHYSFENPYVENPPALPGITRWTAAANSAPSTNANVPGQPYETFTNCLDDAFLTAANTLEQRRKSYGPDNPEVATWLEGQNTVFTNCSQTGKTANLPNPPPPTPAYGSNKTAPTKSPPPTSTPPTTTPPSPSSAPSPPITPPPGTPSPPTSSPEPCSAAPSWPPTPPTTPISPT